MNDYVIKVMDIYKIEDKYFKKRWRWQKRRFLKKHPELKAYWDERFKEKAKQHPLHNFLRPETLPHDPCIIDEDFFYRD
jgi:hypothetical protein